MNILVMNFFPAFQPPTSGGELRYFNIYYHLSKEHNITLLSPTYCDHKLECINFSESFREYRIPKEDIHNQLHMEIDKEEIGQEISALVCALSSKTPNKYHEYYNKLYQQSDIIIHDFPYMLEYDLFFGVDNKPRIYNSHNYESFLVKQIWKGPNAPKFLNYINSLERRLVLGSEIVFTTSEEEKISFIREFGASAEKIHLAPNGINPKEWEVDGLLKRLLREKNKNVKKALFIGSAHPPNIEATEFIINNIAPKCPNIEFIIAGNCCDPFKNKKFGNNIKLLGRIDEKTKEDVFVNTDVAINPMFSGAGTNLKTLEYLSAGIPLISTDCGVRGINLVNRDHFLLASKTDFAAKIIELLDDEILMESISKKGRDFINSHFSWESIAVNINSKINKLQAIADKKIIFVLNDFECSSPVSGGEVRINQLYSHLSNNNKVILLCLNGSDKIKLTNINKSFIEISVPKTSKHIDEEISINKQHWISATDIVTSYMVSKNEFLTNITHNCAHISDLIILSHPYMVDALNINIEKPVVYESHNFETDLKMKLLKGHPKYEFLINKVTIAETKAMQLSKFVISVSDNDHEGLNSLISSSKKVYTIQNGVEIAHSSENLDLIKVKRIFGSHPIVLFIGSSHQPNVDAANFIVNQLANELANCYFIIIGSVCDAITDIAPDNVLLFGKLDEDYKNALLKISDIAINPMASGSGSNLKIAEYFSHKLPVVTTKFGARGFSIQHEKEALICDLFETKKQISKLIDDLELKSKLATNAFNYVTSELDWGILASKLDGIIKQEIFRGNSQKKKMLIVTYRFTNPPLGGAEAYMLNLVEQLDTIGDFSIDIASVNLKDLYNKYHFAIDGSNLKNEKNIGLFQDTILHYFQSDKLSDNMLIENSRMLYNSWMEESLTISLDHLDKYDKNMLLGGWYYPEKDNDKYSVWSSGKALIFINEAEKLILKGISPKRKKISVILNSNSNIFNKTIYGNFEILLEGPFNRDVISIETDTHTDGADPRTFGFILKTIEYMDESTIKELPLIEDYKEFMKSYYPERYIESLIKIAEGREGKLEALFQRTRGPVSSELEKWLENNAHQYDVIVGHSIPFNTSVVAAQYAKKFTKPYVVIPHFHMEDEFYHWKSYYDILRQADKIVAFPNKAIQWFYNKINANNTLSLPGGAVNPPEYVVDNDSSFFTLYASKLPYVLVLGRKTGAKNYKWVIEAVKKVNKNEKKCNLVLIGRDEDFEPIHPDEAFYFNELERPVVISALKHCSCLVTMSESESFGIVILEAWMQGKPVIVNEKCAAFVELVQDNVDGIISTKDNLSLNINKILTDTSFSKCLGESGREKVVKSYTWESVAMELSRELRKMLALD
ncbi:D-inositol-3-phosphate glycosyltransferase [Paenibacillus konkukensis]|uniref:D-inositol-3-phosphate glycosyltransferase n=1 Tax=Paenibacillus konkukensis TaxID=2020716 RepID=A0ABY4RNE2_9BACL|nr:glycosyltransferase family 4 protein [Paenibacillus konkukensis]UQZ83956.1 D-inositol-3-phosphate glycosyltransferase [Paenibacillus konkukensis]